MTISPRNLRGNTRDSFKLAKWMAGDFSNYRQAAVIPQKCDRIYMFFRFWLIIYFGRTDFVLEQAYKYFLWMSYRQGIHNNLSNSCHYIDLQYSCLKTT